jgi:glycosyltransferase involved in cell wall biosynthesis
MLVANTFEGDARVHRTAAALAAAGWDVTLLARHRAGLPVDERIDGFRVRRLAAGPEKARRIGRWLTGPAAMAVRAARRLVHRAPIMRRYAAAADFRRRQVRLLAYCRMVLAHARNAPPDVIHAHDFPCLQAAHRVWMDAGVPYVYDSHELWTERNRLDAVIAAGEPEWERQREEAAIRKAAFTITVCDSIADHLVHAYQIPRPVVLRNTPLRRPEGYVGMTARRALGLTADDFLLVYVGKITRHRGVIDALEALVHLEARFKFVTVGALDPRFADEFAAAIERFGVAPRVFAFGPVPHSDVASAITDCDVSLVTMNRVCLSYAYALPNKLFESLQAGLPVIGPDSPEIEKIIASYGCGLTYRDRDGRHLAATITTLAADPALRSRLKAGAVDAARTLCWENEQVKLREAYGQLPPGR